MNAIRKPPAPTDEHAVRQRALDMAADAFLIGRTGAVFKHGWKVVGDGTKAPRTQLDRAEVLHAVAGRLLHRHDYLSAERAETTALEMAPGTPAILGVRGEARFQLGHYGDAEDDARAALTAAPSLVPAWDLLARVLRESGRPEAALDTAREAVDATGQAAGAFEVLATALRALGRLEDAEQACSDALKRGPAKPHGVLLALGHLKLERGDMEGAEAAYRRVLAANPRSAEAASALINALNATGRAADAALVMEAAVARIPGFGESRFDVHVPLVDGTARRTPPATLDPALSVLVNPPAVYPALPLGVGLIKASVERDSGLTCRVMDLNGDWFRRFVDALDTGSASVSFEDARDFVTAARGFQNGGEAFHDAEQYTGHSEIFVKYLSFFMNATTERVRRVMDTDGPLPWYILDYARKVMADGPSVVGFSVMFTDQLPFALLLARAVKRLDPRVITVFGGCFFKDSELEGFIARFEVDHVILNEGEAAFRDLLERLRDGRDVEGVSGLVRRRPDGSVERNANAFAVKHDDLPYADFSDIDRAGLFMPEPVVPLVSSRGCYWRRCTFCNHFASYAGTYKVQSIERVVDEMAHHITATGSRHFTFVDEMISAKRFQKIARDILSRGLDVRYYALAKPTDDFTPEILELMYDSGCRAVYWGMESGNERVLALMDKGNTVKSSNETLEAAAAAGIHNHLFVIVGFPTETPAEFEDTVRLIHARADVIDNVVAGAFVLEKGTPAHDRHADFGLSKIYPRRSLCNSRLVPYEVSRGMSQGDADRRAELLRKRMLNSLSPLGPFFGTPRDHVILHYGAQPRNTPVRRPKSVPPLADLLRLLNDPEARAEPLDFSLRPVWPRPV